MAFDDGLAERLREALRRASTAPVEEKKMFGGLAFMLRGHMCCGVSHKGDAMFRLPPNRHEHAIGRPGARAMDFTGRPMRGFVFVDSSVTDEALQGWVDEAAAYALSLPEKAPKPKAKPKTKGKTAPG